MQGLYKLSGTDQLRLAVTRTYKAPPIEDLMPRRYAVDNDNSATHPDTMGNPALRPELAWGLDAGYQHALGRGALLSGSMFVRRISDVTVMRLDQSAGVWVSAPANEGVADVHGVELDARLPLSAVWSNAPALDLRANLTRNWSRVRVRTLAGPDNRLARQTPLSANAGFDYRPRGLALALGANFTYQAQAALREMASLVSSTGAKRELDLYGLWTLCSGTQLRLAAANLLHRDERDGERYTDQGGSIVRQGTERTGVTWRVSLGQRF